MVALVLLSADATAQSKKSKYKFISPYSWEITDSVGEGGTSVPAGKVTKADFKEDKQVGIFYWTWHTDIVGRDNYVADLQKILKEFPEAANEKDHPVWEGWGRNYYWDEPIYGYYIDTDKWVLRKQAELLASAGVDFVLFDNTNGAFTWLSSMMALIEVWEAAQKDGVKSPKFAVMSNFAPFPSARDQIIQIYQAIYSKGIGKDLWMMVDGKPLILAYPEMLENGVPEGHVEICKEIRQFFTFRPPQPDYVDGPTRVDQWSWLENYPQHGYGSTPDGGYEMVSVGVAQNANAENGGHAYAFNVGDAFSRSFSQRKGYDPRPNAHLYGWNFKEQWERAFELDPKIVFVTGWNEWTVGRHENWPPHKPARPFAFPDQYNADRSRDIEPVKSWGKHGDAYYVMLVDHIRKFKGVKSGEDTAPRLLKATIDIDSEAAWNKVSNTFRSYRNTAINRDSLGAGQIHYVNKTGRNSISSSKVAYDDDFVYFIARTDNELSPKSDPKWMRLLIDADNSRDTGWEGYDIIVNRESPGDKALVEKHAGKGEDEWKWEKAGDAEYAVFKKAFAVKLPRALFGGASKPLRFNFKWSDNMQEDGNIMDFYVNGSCAPIGRFNFSARSE